mgnify:CR=1 FL=1
MARTTTMRLAPASRTWSRFPRSIPPMAYQGFSPRFSAAQRTYASPAAGLPGFVGVSQTGPTER